jgi:FkbM family methyltransferase
MARGWGHAARTGRSNTAPVADRSLAEERRLEALEQQLESQARTLRQLRREIHALESRLVRATEKNRAFALLLPSLNSQDRTLEVSVASRLFIPKKIEGTGLAGYEGPTLACWLTLLNLDGVHEVFDVGANVGPFTWLAAALTPHEVVAFEPVPYLLEALGEIAGQNGLRVIRESIALADHDGQATLYLSDKSDTSNSLVQGHRPSSKSLSIEVRQLDTYAAATGRIPDVLKIDTETNEPEVLAGGMRTIREHRPWMIVEVLPGAQAEERLMRLLQPLGYIYYQITDAVPLVPRSRIVADPDLVHMNWLLAPAPLNEPFWTSFQEWRAAIEACTPI